MTINGLSLKGSVTLHTIFKQRPWKQLKKHDHSKRKTAKTSATFE